MQLIGAATPDVPNHTPMPQPSKQLLNACLVPPMQISVTLLAGCQSAIVSSHEWHNDMNPAFISTIMAPNFKNKEVDCESLTPTRGATQKSVDCESLTPTRGATQQSVDCESLTPT